MSSQEINTARVTVSARWIGAVLAFAIALVAFVAGAEPAAAHDELISATPAADSSVEGLPTEVRLAFSGVLSAEQGATEVAVLDAAGASIASGAPVVQDNTVTQALDAASAATGVVQVLWKVVSSDGHPISGEYSFTVTAAPAPTPTETSTAEPAPTAEPESPQPTETVTSAPAPGEAASSSNPWPWVIGIVVAVLVLGAVSYLVASRVRRDRALDGHGANGTQTESDGPRER
ncbi:copper resistance protein CopC [Microbacterium sp. BWT-B31]|uniref:copper resistance CopC family protein n=1 Tax=Microbacterium sp. BWT-B31 TaxID=3232072 RepID=UPI00352806CE